MKPLRIKRGDKPSYVGSLTGVGTKKSPHISFDGGCLHVDKMMPYMRVGATVETYGQSGLGGKIRGIVIDGHIVRYRTEAQSRADDKKMLAKLHKDSIKAYKKALPQMEADYRALPMPFRKRMDRLRLASPDDRHMWESYEMFILTEAVKLAKALKTPAVVEKYRAANYYEQRKMAPEISDGHSDNTHGGMCVMAWRWLKGMKL